MDADTDAARFPDDAMLRYLGAGVRRVQTTVYSARPKSRAFMATQERGMNRSGRHDLPDDILAPGAVYSVRLLPNGPPLAQTSPRAMPPSGGEYVNTGTVLVLAPLDSVDPAIDRFAIDYAQALPAPASLSSRPGLPAALEEYLVSYMVRRMKFADSSDQAQDAMETSRDEERRILSLWTAGDYQTPPITDPGRFVL